MASDYGLNFGFRRSDESVTTREGNFKTPVGGSALLLGTAVEIDPAVPGYLKACAANAQPLSGTHGLLVQEENHLPELFDVPGHDSISLGTAKKDRRSVITAGVGCKVWFRNTAAYSRAGRTKGAVEIVTETGLVVGDQIGWDGSKWVEADGTPTPVWMTVTRVSADYCEAVLSF